MADNDTELEDRVARLESEADELGDDLAKAEASLDIANERISELTDALNTLQSDLEGAERELDEANSRIVGCIRGISNII